MWFSDAVTCALLLVAVGVLVTGGVRWYGWGIRISLTSAWRPFAWALATFSDDNSVRLLRERGIQYVVLHEAFYCRPRYAALTAAADRRTDLKEVFRAGAARRTPASTASRRRDARCWPLIASALTARAGAQILLATSAVRARDSACREQ